jgi:hypothetical protein
VGIEIADTPGLVRTRLGISRAFGADTVSVCVVWLAHTGAAGADLIGGALEG